MKWLLFLTLTAWIYLVLLWVTFRRRQLQSRITDVLPHKSSHGLPIKDASQTLSVRKLAGKVAASWVRGWSRGRLEKLQLKLSLAGNPMNFTAAEWIGFRLTTTGLGVGLGGCLLWMSHGGLRGLGALLAFVLLGWIGPDFWLSKQVVARQRLMLKQLPSALDLLTVSVEAGLGFDQAMSRVAQRMQGPLTEEFERTLREMQLGSQRSEALQRMATRTQIDAIQTFTSAVIQADKLGIGMAQVLRIQSGDVRRKRRMDAEERALKAPVKMLFPLVMFVFPALFIIILGPAAIHVYVAFSGKS